MVEPMNHLFEPYAIRDVTLRNRSVMAPMCQYSAKNDGHATPWHQVHLGSRAVGGVGLILVEATAVEPRGRISTGDLGLWNDTQIDPLRSICAFCETQGAVIGVQLAHAGRKAGTSHQGHWKDESVAPSAVPFATNWRIPHELSTSEIADVVGSFVAAARRSIEAGFRVLELHGAHGYLISSFTSPLANRRTDAYGGDIHGRARFAVEVASSVRAVMPNGMPLLMRLSGSDLDPTGNSVEDMAVVAKMVHEVGVDIIHVSAGGNSPTGPVGRTNMVELAAHIRQAACVPTIGVGDIRTAEQADDVIRSGKADLVALGRELLRNPYWPLAAARALDKDMEYPQQYLGARD